MSLTTQKNRRNSKRLYAGIAIVLLVVAGLGAVLWYKDYSAKRDLQSRIKAQDEAQTQSAKNDSLNTDNKETPVQPSGSTSEQVEKSPTTLIVIDTFTQKDHLVQTSAHSTDPTGAGSCVFQFSAADSRPVVKQVAARNGTCSVSIAETEFDRIGTWKLKVTYYMNSQKSEAEEDVLIQ